MKRAHCIIIAILLFALRSSAQSSGHGDVVVHSDPRLSILMKKKIVMQASSVKPEHHAIAAKLPKPTAHNPTEVASAKTTTHSPNDVVMASTNSKSVKPIATVETHPVSGPHAPATTRPVAAETKHGNEGENSHPVTSRPVYLRKEGRVIYSGKGFRVQIYSGADREKAINVKTEFMRRFPATRTYITYVSPSFRVKVGNYRSRGDAMGMYKEAKSMYSPCVIVPDIITINTY